MFKFLKCWASKLRKKGGEFREFRYRLFRSANYSSFGCSGSNSSSSNSDSSRYYSRELGHSMDPWYNRRIIPIASAGIVGSLFFALIPAIPAYAADIDMSSQQNLTGIDSSYFTGKSIAINKPTSTAFEGFNPSSISYTADGGTGSVSMDKPFNYQWSCPETVTHFTDCHVLVTIAAPYLAKMVQGYGDNNIYSPTYNINDNIQYFIIVSAGGLSFKVPLLYSKDGTILTSRIWWDKYPANSFTVVNGQCYLSCKQGSTNVLSGNASSTAFDFAGYATNNTSYRIIKDKRQIVACIHSSSAACNTQSYQGNMPQTQMLTSVYSGEGKSVGETIRDLGATEFSVSLSGYYYSDFTRSSVQVYDNFFEWILDPSAILSGLFGDPEGYAVQPFALGTASKPLGAVNSTYGVANFYYKFSYIQPTLNPGEFCLDSPMQPKYIIVSCGGLTYPSSQIGNDLYLFAFGASTYGPSTSWVTTSNARTYLEEVGNTVDVPTVNCETDCDTLVINNIDYGNKVDPVDPYTNPDDRPGLNECFTGSIITFDFVVDWDCIMTSLFLPDLEVLNSSINDTSGTISTVLFPLAYAVYSFTILQDFLGLLQTDTCIPFKVPFPLIGEQIMIPCPAQSAPMGDLASASRIIVPWFIVFTFGLMMIRRVTSKFGFGSGQGNLAVSTYDAPDPAATAQRQVDVSDAKKAIYKARE